MIIPMKKYSFLVYHKEYQEFLKKIRNLGAVHIIEKQGGLPEDEDLSKNLSLYKRYNSTIKILSKKKVQPLDPSKEKGLLLLEKYEALIFDLEKTKQKILQNSKEAAQYNPWGNFSWESVEKLKKAGFYIRFFSCPTRKLMKEWEEEYNLFFINEISTVEYFITLTKNPDFHIDADEITLPSRSLTQINAEQQQLQQLVKDLENEVDKIASTAIPALMEAKASVQEQIDFKKVILNTSAEAEDKVMVLEAWSSVEKTEELDLFLEQSGVYYEVRDPEETDNVPVKLKNNKFAKLYEVIGNLYSLPNYNELDLTPFFAPFYMLFFGFCLGDAGYGLLFILGALFYRRKAKPAMKPILSLITWLGLATVIMGAISGTIFGINLIEADIPWLTDAKQYMLNPDKLFNLSLIIGVVQIMFGMVLKVVNITKQKGFRYAFSTVGWIILILGSIALMGLTKMGIISEDIKTYGMYGVFGISGLLILILNDPKRNVFINFGSGLWETYNQVTGLLGDVLSYIRLFALGISSAVMGFVFNDLAISLSGNTPVLSQLIMVIILLIGHGMNIFMSGLGAMVHPMRLTFVEFYKNAGFKGGGKKYQPFSKLVK